MTKYLITIAILFAGWNASAETIELLDGTTVTGEIVGFSRGHYKVQTSSLGTIKIDERQISSINYGKSSREGHASNRSSNDHSAEQIKQLQLGLAKDASLMNAIQGLQSSPQIQEILNDPEIMQAVMSYDVGTLMNNKKFMALMNNSDIQAISKQALGQ